MNIKRGFAVLLSALLVCTSFNALACGCKDTKKAEAAKEQAK